MTERNPALWIQARTDHTAENDRAILTALFAGREGIIQPGHLAVSQRGAGANMSVDVAAGLASVIGDDNANQGQYLVWNDATANLVIAAADATNPRIDIVIARVRDAFYTGATNAFDLAVVTGTPAGSPAEPALPNNSIKLATVAVAALASSIVNANITDTRARASSLGAPIICASTTRPTSPLWEGMRIYETDTNREWIYTGSAWRLLATMNVPRCEAVRTAAQSISASSVTEVAFNATDLVDTDSLHDIVTNNSRVLLNQIGLWTVHYSIIWAGAAGGQRATWICKNDAGVGTGARRYGWIDTPGGASVSTQHSTSVQIESAAVTDYVELFVFQDTAGAVNIAGSGVQGDCILSVEYAGPIF